MFTDKDIYERCTCYQQKNWKIIAKAGYVTVKNKQGEVIVFKGNSKEEL